uniref:Metalloendopeptidase n=1 Tax=Neogobius melanostomus TaxID=47308 RepID=A0A8C6TPH3_9GOBI
MNEHGAGERESAWAQNRTTTSTLALTDREEMSYIGILTSNKKSSKFLLEGDIQVPRTRNAMRCWYNSCRWLKGQDGKVTIAYKVISTALREIESKTCIRFVPRQYEYDYISVENKAGCYSNLGKQGGRQELSLQRNGCIYKGIIQHEFLHTLGFKHEQTRSDRDRYVRINWANMDRSMVYNFYRSYTDNLNTPYDYNSIMHYGRTIGQRQGPSNWDIQRINLLYNC